MPQTISQTLNAQQTKQTVNQNTLTVSLPITASSTGQTQQEDKKTTFEKFFGIDLQSVMFVLAGLILIYIGIGIFIQPIAIAAAKEVTKAGVVAAKAAV